MRSSPLIKRFISGVGANVYSQFVTLFGQLATVPVCITIWGVELYGAWIALFAIPSFLAATNLGIANAAATDMTMMNNQKDVDTAKVKAVYHTACLTILCMTLLVTGLCFLAYLFVGDIVPFKELVDPDITKSTVLVLICYTMVSFFCGLPEAVFKSTERYAEGVFLTNTLRLVEYLAFIVGLFFYEINFLTAAYIFLSVRIIGLLIIFIYMKATNAAFVFGVSSASWAIIKKLLPACTGFITMPIGFALIIQGLTLVAASFSTVFAAQLNLTRTITSVGRQVASIIGNASWPEMSKAYGEGDQKKVMRIFALSLKSSLLIAIAYFIFIAFVGELLFKYWTSDQLDFNYTLFIIFSVSALLGNVWTQAYVLLASNNKHLVFSLFLVLVGGLTLLAANTLVQSGVGFVNAMSVTILTDFTLIIIAFTLIYREKKLSKSKVEN